MKKVLIITYYWPPSGGVGTQRWLKFTKYLRGFGWEPVIFTPENPDFDMMDDSGERDVPEGVEAIKLPIWEPYHIYKKLKGDKEGNRLKQGVVLESGNKSVLDKLSIWLRGNLLIPDPRRFWVKPAFNFLEGIIESKGIDLVVTTSPPHSMHLIGLQLKRKLGVTWLADFRDPWSQWDLLDKLQTSFLAKMVHRKLERNVLKNADLVVATSQRQAEDFKQLGARSTAVITNGFDEDDCPQLPEVRNTKFVLSHVGLLNEIRDPVTFLNVLERLCEDASFAKDFELRLGGTISESIKERIESSPTLGECTTFLSYIPHSEIYEEYARASVLLLILNNSNNSKCILPSKLYEYIYTELPVLMLGETDSDAAAITLQFKNNKVAEFDSPEMIEAAIMHYYQQFKAGGLGRNKEDKSRFSRKNLTRDLVNLFNSLTND